MSYKCLLKNMTDWAVIFLERCTRGMLRGGSPSWTNMFVARVGHCAMSGGEHEKWIRVYSTCLKNKQYFIVDWLCFERNASLSSSQNISSTRLNGKCVFVFWSFFLFFEVFFLVNCVLFLSGKVWYVNGWKWCWLEKKKKNELASRGWGTEVLKLKALLFFSPAHKPKC